MEDTYHRDAFTAGEQKQEAINIECTLKVPPKYESPPVPVPVGSPPCRQKCRIDLKSSVN